MIYAGGKISIQKEKSVFLHIRKKIFLITSLVHQLFPEILSKKTDNFLKIIVSGQKFSDNN